MQKMIAKGYKSSKTIKAWCKARGLDFRAHMSQFPLASCNYYIPPAIRLEGKGVFQKIKEFIWRIKRSLSAPRLA